jgi:adenylate cyclase
MTWRKSLAGILPSLLVLAGLIGLRALDPGPVRQARDITFDSYQRIKPRPAGGDIVRIVDIDEASLARLGQWPWPRTRLAEMTRRLAESGALVVGFDIMFAEPDRLSPREVIKLWPRTEETTALELRLAELPEHDRVFAEALAKAPAVTGFAVTRDPGGRAPASKAGFRIAGPDPTAAVRGGQGAVTTLPVLEAAAKGNGALNWFGERDNVVRAVPILVRHGDQLYPGFAAEILRVAVGAPGYRVTARAGGDGEASVAAVQVGDYRMPTDRRGHMRLYAARPDARRYIPAWKVLEPDFDAAAVKDRIVLVGASAVGLHDLRATALVEAMPGVEIHAHAIEQIADALHLIRPDWADWAEFGAMLLGGLLILWLVPRIGALWAGVVGLSGLVIVLGASWIAFSQARLLLDGVYPAGALVVTLLAATLAVYLRSERERRQVRGAFGRYLAPALVERLAADPSQLKLGGEMREMTLLFSDIRGFTSLSEGFDAAGLTQFMNRYLTPMTDEILKHRGTVDKYMGDAIMAFWNAPLGDVDHALNACRAALAMMRRLAAFNAELAAEAAKAGRPHRPVAIGIGLNTALCCVGNMGSEQRFDYSVLGDGVNLASRIEGLTKLYGVPILVGENTRRAAPGFAAFEVDRVRAKGKVQSTTLFALVGDAKRAAEPGFAAFAAAQERFLAAYRARDWPAAEALLAAAKAAAGGEHEGLFALYGERLAAFRAAPPPAEWDGVYEATEK